MADFLRAMLPLIVVFGALIAGSAVWWIGCKVMNLYHRYIYQPATVKLIQKWLSEGGNEVYEHMSWAYGYLVTVHFGKTHRNWYEYGCSSEDELTALIQKHATVPVTYRYGDQGGRSRCQVIQPLVRAAKA